MNNDRLTGLAVLVLCLFAWLVILPGYVEGSSQKIFPEAILVLLALPALFMVIHPHPDPKKAAPRPEVRSAQRKAACKAAIMAACYLGYLLLIPVLGFYLSSMAATVGFLYFLEVRKPVVLVLVPAGMMLTIHLIIERGLRFTLPTGFWM